MKFRILRALLMAAVCTGVLYQSTDAPKVSAQTTAPVYNPYPPGILPPDLNPEIERVLREVRVVEKRALARWRTMTPPTLTGQPPILQGTGTEAVETLGELMNYDKTSPPTGI